MSARSPKPGEKLPTRTQDQRTIEIIDALFSFEQKKCDNKLRYLNPKLQALSEQNIQYFEMNINSLYHHSKADAEARERRRQVDRQHKEVLDLDQQSANKAAKLETLAKQYKINLKNKERNVGGKNYHSTERYAGEGAYTNYKKRKFLVNDKYQQKLKKRQEDEFKEVRKMIEKGIKREEELAERKRAWKEEAERERQEEEERKLRRAQMLKKLEKEEQA
jgi:hypothetical protein